MPLMRDEDDGTWSFQPSEEDAEKVAESHPSYFDALPRYLTAFDVAFTRAKRANEWEFILSLLAIRGMQDAGWDPYETTLEALESMRKLHDLGRDDPTGQRHLELWTYGHIVEASAPYDLLANMVAVAAGQRYRTNHFPDRQSGAPMSPGEKIARLEQMGQQCGIAGVAAPIREVWNREFRNSVFHADYTLYGSEVRTIRPMRTYDHDAVMTLINRALAYQESIKVLRTFHISSYTEPVVIPVSREFSPDPEERATVIVREGYGVTGVKDAWTAEELRAGKIPFQLGRFTREEIELLDADRSLARLPARRE